MNDSNPRSRWPLVVALLGILALVIAGYLIHRATSLPAELMERGRSLARDVRSVAAAFRSGTITTTFTSHAVEMSGSHYLQFATLKEMEVFERTDSVALLWGQLALPDVVVRAEAPVEYTYYLDLDERWEFVLSDAATRAVLVRAPEIRFNTPAIDASRIRYEVKDGSILRDEAAAVENLKRGITDLARERARENRAIVRELGRKKTEDFIRSWLLSSYDDAAEYRVEVRFADEADPDDPPRERLTPR